jgi:hypothetical protein
MAKRKVIVSEDAAPEVIGTDINNKLDDLSAKGRNLKQIPKDDVVNEMMSDINEVRSAEKVTILIHSGAGKLGGEPVFVAVNGIGYSIPRDKPVSVPLPILLALENAKETRHYREEVDSKSAGPVIARQVPRFAITRK